jgi:hypothetical protein
MKVTKHKKANPAKKNEFPGYPQYSPNDDITNRAKRVDLNVDEDVVNGKASTITNAGNTSHPIVKKDSHLKDNSNVTQEDLEALGPKDLSMDMGDDEALKHRTTPVDFAGEDLDIPGSELYNDSESIGSEDEENNSYSLGGDNHNDLEEDQA